MGTRTANGTGNIRKRPNGTWEARLSYVDGDGTLKRVSVYGKTQREVREKTKAVRDRVDNGAPANDDKMALAAWMARWRGGAKPHLRPRIARKQPGRCTQR